MHQPGSAAGPGPGGNVPGVAASPAAPAAGSGPPPPSVPVGGAAAVMAPPPPVASAAAPLPPGGGGGGEFLPDDPLLVEVQGENGAYYKARVRDVFPDASEVLLCFERDWQPQSRFPLSRVRLPPPHSLHMQPPHYTEGQEIEVYSRASDQVSTS